MLKNIINKITGGNARTAAVKKNIISLLALKGVSLLISFMLVPATLNYVSSEIYGVWLTIASILTALQLFDIGLTQGLKNKLAEALSLNDMKRAKSLVSTTYASMCLIFIPVSVILYFLVGIIDWPALLKISDTYSAEIKQSMQVVSFLVCIQMIANIISSVVSAYQKVAMVNLFLVIGNLLAYISIIILRHTVPPSLPILTLVLAGAPIMVMIISSIILFNTSYRSVRPSLRCADFSLVKNLMTLGIKFFIINVQCLVVYQSTNFLISYVATPDAVTVYNIAYKYLNIAMVVFANLMIPLWPAFTDAYTQRDYSWMNNMRSKMNKILLVCIGVCIFMALISQPAYHIWIGKTPHIPNTMTWTVMIYVIIYCYMNLNGTILLGIGKVHLETILVTIGMILYIPFALGLAKLLGEYGVVVALIITNLIYAIFFHIQTNKILSGRAKGIWDK